jgi:energy-coupling factor transporter ATP-binding protein EcfA2
VRAGLENMNAVKITNLSYCFHDGSRALDDISFTVTAGEKVGIIGPNGAGKSTLLWHLNGILPDKPGDSSPVTILGLPVIQKNLAVIRSHVGLLFQNPDDQLFCPTVGEDVAFGPLQLGKKEPELREIVRRALGVAGMTGFENRPTQHLSQGEKHRVCLAGVLACEAQILALDEPTSDLDPRGRRELRELLQVLPVTQIIATHDLELVVELCQRVIVMDNGRIIADGPTTELLDNEPLMLTHGLERPHILRHRHPH